jgi:hypothetical protein
LPERAANGSSSRPRQKVLGRIFQAFHVRRTETDKDLLDS